MRSCLKTLQRCFLVILERIYTNDHMFPLSILQCPPRYRIGLLFTGIKHFHQYNYFNNIFWSQLYFNSILRKINFVMNNRKNIKCYHNHLRLPKLPGFAFLLAGPFVFLLSFLRLFEWFGVVEITLKKPSSLPWTEVLRAFCSFRIDSCPRWKEEIQFIRLELRSFYFSWTDYHCPNG